MGTFGGISTALSSLIAQRTALDVHGQNIANANTRGYTRQRAELGAITTVQVPSMFATSDGVGAGVRVTGVARADDAFLDAKLRTQTAGAAYLTARAEVYATLESSLGEPSETGLASALSTFWADWHDVANNPHVSSTRAVLLDDARQLADSLHQLHADVATQWRQARTTAITLVDQANATAANVAELNGRILGVTVAGGAAHELADQRDLLVTQLSDLVGVTVQPREDGQLDLFVGGNALVFGSTARVLTVAGAADFGQAAGYDATPAYGVHLEWADRPGQRVPMAAGEVTGLLTALAAPEPDGTGGILTEAAMRLDAVATSLVERVNAIHYTALTTGGTTNQNFFVPLAAGSAAAQIGVAISAPQDVAVAAAGLGANDGSIGQLIADLGLASDGPDDEWNRTVVETANRTAAALSRSTVAELARTSAEQDQLAQASVDTDEETVAMLAAQRAYEAAARVMTAIDEMLDVLINRTGIVGR